MPEPEPIELREGKTISAATAETLKQVQALHSAASSAIDGLLNPDDTADGDGDDAGVGEDGTEDDPSTDPGVSQDATGSRAQALPVPVVVRGLPLPAIQRTFVQRAVEFR